MDEIIAASLTRIEIAIAALAEAADCLAGADAPELFVAALDNNHRLWRRLRDVAPVSGWPMPERRLRDFILAASSHNSRRVSDSDVEVLILLNRDVAAEYCSGRDRGQVRVEAELAWRNSGAVLGTPFQAWLLAELG